MEIRFAKIISYLFHPLLVPTYGFAFIFFTENYISTFIPSLLKYIILGVTFLFTFLLPTINALILLKMKRIQSLEMETNQERIIPYSSTALYFFALFYLFYDAEFPAIFIIVILGAGISILLTFLINFKWKISAHTVGIGGIAGATLGIIYRMEMDMSVAFISILLLSGIVAYARLKLNAHTPAQVYTGFVMGFIIELGLMLFY
ncbi:MAG TPA: hypothetical protein VJI69_07660 [Bacteroidia bacterium]|nr:hypothetical protein [Bacteroidia bacterium]